METGNPNWDGRLTIGDRSYSQRVINATLLADMLYQLAGNKRKLGELVSKVTIVHGLQGSLADLVAIVGMGKRADIGVGFKDSPLTPAPCYIRVAHQADVVWVELWLKSVKRFVPQVHPSQTDPSIALNRFTEIVHRIDVPGLFV